MWERGLQEGGDSFPGCNVEETRDKRWMGRWGPHSRWRKICSQRALVSCLLSPGPWKEGTLSCALKWGLFWQKQGLKWCPSQFYRVGIGEIRLVLHAPLGGCGGAEGADGRSPGSEWGQHRMSSAGLRAGDWPSLWLPVSTGHWSRSRPVAMEGGDVAGRPTGAWREGLHQVLSCHFPCGKEGKGKEQPWEAVLD